MATCLFPSPWCTCTGGSSVALACWLCLQGLGYQNPWFISAESTVLWGWVRTLDLAPCCTTRNQAGLFTHLAEVWTSGKLAGPQRTTAGAQS